MGAIMGAEDKGIRRLNRKACDQLVKIPMFGHVNCLNVSVAAGVALYEIVRQKMEANDHISPDFIDVED